MDTKNKYFLRALKGESLIRPPFWLMRQAGRYLPEYRELRQKSKNFLDFCYSPDLAVEATLQPLRRYDFDAAILFSDILVIPDALGQKVEFREGEGPVLEPVRSIDDVDKLSLDGLHDHLAPVYQTVSRLSSEIPQQTALIGFAGAPWTVATYMVEGKGSKDYARARTWAYADPEGFGKLIDLLVEATTAYLIKQIENGAEVIQLFDTWAGVLSENQFQRWVIQPTVEIVKRLNKACPGVPILGFPRGAGILYQDFVKQTGVDGVSLDNSVPVSWAAEHLQPLCTVQGNLDNMALIAGGEAMENEIRAILEGFAGGPHIFNLGHGILPETPPEHVERLAALIQGWES
ncbi:MAG: uroporphyrinogen decarboxylase [Rhodospirillaceae bacterium]|nr:uroporphyrinogen decarboxylase [Rhodospirillaceae bacterium]MBL6930373.1 uroporphyrinogen decarboxylase [Rhodospirillales bacterium]MBL6941150.1 uroporphyrinogen decarboxylase [Rhodospirillales bacterium]